MLQYLILVFANFSPVLIHKQKDKIIGNSVYLGLGKSKMEVANIDIKQQGRSKQLWTSPLFNNRWQLARPSLVY